MRKETDMNAVKDMAIAFLHITPEPVSGFEIFITHPMLETAIARTKNGGLFNIFDEPEKYKIWQEDMEAGIKTCSNVYAICEMIRNSYKLTFFKFVNKFLAEKDFAKLLIACWTETEFPSNDINVSLTEIVKWFSKAKHQYLMDTEEKEVFNNLPDEVEIYRGISDEKYKEGISWTLSYDKAKWFAERFAQEDVSPIIYMTRISKEDILSYINRRDEQEIIVNSKCLKKYTISEEVLER